MLFWSEKPEYYEYQYRKELQFAIPFFVFKLIRISLQAILPEFN